MNLIYYPGLNCHLACAVTLADFLGVDYKNAFATLWSETDFEYEPMHGIYLSKRVIPNLRANGAALDKLTPQAEETRQEVLLPMRENELFIVGMDIFYIPWHLMYRSFHGVHFFIAQMGKSDSLTCFDPIYNKKYQPIGLDSVLAHFFEVECVHKVTAETPQPNLYEEACGILENHTQLKESLMAQFNEYNSLNCQERTLLNKRINAMVSNRNLFRQFIHHSPLPNFYKSEKEYFNKDFLLQWEAFKNGTIKALILKDGAALMRELCSMLSDLIDVEILMAKDIITQMRGTGIY